MDETNTKNIHIIIIRSGRKTIALTVGPDGEVIVRAPYRVGESQIRRFVSSKLPWIERQQARMAQRRMAREKPLSKEELARLTDLARADLTERCGRFAPLVGVRCGRITIRRQRTRWGSCNGKGDLNFNCLLMLAPETVRDYVVVHELCHCKHMDHSPRFWAEVARVLPGWREQRQWLREHEYALLSRLDTEPAGESAQTT